MLILFLCAFYDVSIFFCQQLFYPLPEYGINTERESITMMRNFAGGNTAGEAETKKSGR